LKDYIRLLASVKLALQQRFTKREEHLAALTDVEVKKMAYNKVSNQTNKSEKASTKQVLIFFIFYYLFLFILSLNVALFLVFMPILHLFYPFFLSFLFLLFVTIVILLLFHIAFVFYFLILFDIPVYSCTVPLFMLILTPILIWDFLK
jgi:hypothetical protein